MIEMFIIKSIKLFAITGINKYEKEVCDILVKEVVDGEMHHLV